MRGALGGGCDCVWVDCRFTRRFVVLATSMQVIVVVQDLDEDVQADEEEELRAKVPKVEVADLRELLQRQEEPGVTGLFSAAEFIPIGDNKTK